MGSQSIRPGLRFFTTLAHMFVEKRIFTGVLLSAFVLALIPVAYSQDLHTNLNIIPPVSDFPQSNARQINGGPFNLTTHLGKNVTDKDFEGSYLLIYFGYSFCPEVCPTDLSVIGKAIDLLGEEGGKVQPLFITFDPARDTKERLAAYVQSFHPRLIGLRGTKEQTLAAANHYGVDVSATYKAELPGSAYSMNHSAFTYLVGPKGNLRVMFKDGTGPQLMAQTIQRHMQQ